MKLHVGCAMWAHAAWPGRYLPQPLPPRERLRAYASWCNAVEGNTTFYGIPGPATVASWAAQAPGDFRFVFKLPREITHDSRLAGAGASTTLRTFLAAIEPLGGRASPLWVQLPPAFGPDGLATLSGFLRQLPAGHRYCVEVRHEAFFREARPRQELERLLHRAGAEWAVFDTTVLFASRPGSDAEREAWANKPRLPRRSQALTAFPVVRYLGRDDPAATAAGWQPWAAQVAGWLREGRSPTVFIHTPDNAAAPELARRFHADVRALVPELDPLPEPVPAGPPTLF